MAALRRNRLTVSTKNVILDLRTSGMSTVQIQRTLERQLSIKTTRQSVRRFLVRHKKTGTVQSIRKPDRKATIKQVHLEFIDMWLEENFELSAKALCDRLFSVFNITITKQYMCALRRRLGWTNKNTKYCQMISTVNVDLRLDWCLGALHTMEAFENVVFVDETSIEMSSSGRLYFYKPRSALEKLPAKAPKPKHAYKVHLWGGISYRGRTDCCIFTGIMDSVIYQKILQDNFLPFVEKKFPDGYRLYQDNDSKHKSKSTKKWMEDVNMLDLNPIENVWSAMKGHLQRHVKPKRKEELVKGIKAYWETLTAERCGKFIDHIHRVIPQVVLNKGKATDF